VVSVLSRSEEKAEWWAYIKNATGMLDAQEAYNVWPCRVPETDVIHFATMALARAAKFASPWVHPASACKNVTPFVRHVQVV